jgi:hypothetical protein
VPKLTATPSTQRWRDSRQLSPSAKNKTRAVTFPHPAGKGTFAPAICSKFPIRQGRKFIDLFAARANITFRAWHEGFEFSEWVLNDIDTSFLLALRDVGDRITVPPRSREEFERQRELAKKEDQRAILLAPWLCFNGGDYSSGGSQLSSPNGGRRTPESYEKNLRAGHKLIKQKAARITPRDWLVCLEEEAPDSRDLVVVDGPYMERNVGIIEPDSILPIELIEKLKSATFNWVLCEYRQPLYLMAFGEPVLQKDVQLRSVNFRQTGGQERRVECVWTSASYRAHLVKNGANRDMSRLAKPVPADRPDTYYAELPLEKLLAEIKDGMGVITGSRLQMNAEMRKRLLPALLVLRKRTYRKHPGFYESLRRIGLNADTVRQWFYRSYTADEVIDLVEDEHLKPKGRDTCETNEDDSGGENANEDAADLTNRSLLMADKLADAVLRDKITLAKRLAREYAKARKLVVGSDAYRQVRKVAA